MKTTWIKLCLPIWVVIIVAPVYFSACTPNSGISVQESDVVVTTFDEQVDFGNLKTFALLDTIMHLTGDPDKPDSDIISRDYDRQILALIAQNFEDRGYQRVSDSQIPPDPDFVVLVSATALQYWNVYGGYPWYPYWGYWPGWGCCGSGWGWYYPPTVGYAYSTGTLIVTMVDPKNADDENKLVPVQWTGAQNGVLDDTKSSKRERVERGINQMFSQSPYLKSEIAP